LRVLTERLGNMRDELLNEMMQYWDRDEESVLGDLSDDMEVDELRGPRRPIVSISGRNNSLEADLVRLLTGCEHLRNCWPRTINAR
jgi:hypothetical protein